MPDPLHSRGAAVAQRLGLQIQMEHFARLRWEEFVRQHPGAEATPESLADLAVMAEDLARVMDASLASVDVVTAGALTDAIRRGTRPRLIGGIADLGRTLGDILEAPLSLPSIIQGWLTTELTAAYAAQQIERMAREGIRYKQWLTMRDEKVRDSHAAADGQVRHITATFAIGGEALMVPGDPSGSPAQTYNCRCIVIAANPEAKNPLLR